MNQDHIRDGIVHKGGIDFWKSLDQDVKVKNKLDDVGAKKKELSNKDKTPESNKQSPEEKRRRDEEAEGTGESNWEAKKPMFGEDWDAYFRSEYGDEKVTWKTKGNAPVPTKPGGGSNPSDFVNPHSEKHMYDPSKPSTPNRSQYGEDVDVRKLRQETMTNPDKAYSNWPNPNNPNPNRITKYYKEFDGNVSTPDTPTGSHRVFEHLDDPTRSSHFPYVPRNKE
nr:hypothetical protein [Paenibacillus fonticola]